MAYQGPLAGTGTRGTDGGVALTQATCTLPEGLNVDSKGRVYVGGYSAAR